MKSNLSKEILDSYIKFTRTRVYMSGVERDRLRIRQTAEVFTPTPLVINVLDQLEKEDPTLFLNPNKTFLDNSCGDGQFLSEVIIRKMEKSMCSLEKALSTTFGVELMKDNVLECRKRLAGPNPTPDILRIVEKNIIHHDALTYDYSFGENQS